VKTWTLRKENIRKMEGFEMWIHVWRTMKKISWTEKIANMKVLRRERRQEQDNYKYCYKKKEKLDRACNEWKWPAEESIREEMSSL